MQEQVYIYGFDTSAFYFPEEEKISREIYEKQKETWDIDSQIKNDKSGKCVLSEDEMIRILDNKKLLRSEINNLKKNLKVLLKSNINKIRNVNPEYIKDANSIKNSISLFSSTLTRTLGMVIDGSTINLELVVVRVYYFDIFKSLVNHGFTLNNEKYIFLTASAGQIRTKKNVFIKESEYKKHYNTLFCGLSLDKINKQGGVNRNKYLAYLALCNSATDVWSGFDIDKCIVIDDVETNVVGEVDYIHTESWMVERKIMPVSINHTDGCGMMLPIVSKKNFMFRMPWFKGLLVAFPFDEWIKVNDGSAVIKDIYGKEYDIFKDNIQIIFTKSQFKMWKYYKSWDEYKRYFKLYNCEAGTCNREEDYIKNGHLSYQMIQTLNDLTDEELKHISKKTLNIINNISSDRDTMLKCFGITKFNKNKNFFQKSLEKYPEMLSDEYTRNILSQIKKKKIKEGISGRLKVDGKYTFISPDWYAMCERIFGMNENVVGLLKDGEVYCSIFRNCEKIDCLRSPHLFKEHAVRKNTYKEKSDEYSKWFCTKALYTSCNDLISKLLMHDNDGDTSLIISDEVIINAAERNCKDVVPLYYEMKKAKDTLIHNNELYEGMIAAYTGGNIGEVSNDISKVWNKNEISNEDVYLVKCLCRKNNEIIDYAKTLYKSPMPKDLENKLKQFSNKKVPYFFMYAKDKKASQVQQKNNSPVNRLENIIISGRFNFNEKQYGKFNYLNLMKNPHLCFSDNNKLHNEIIEFYKKKTHENRGLFNDFDGENGNYNLIYKKIREEMLSEFGDSYFIVDVLVSYFFGKVKSKSKNILWGSFGDILYENIINNINSDTFSCANCGKRVTKIDDPKKNAQKYCGCCSEDIQYYKPIKTKYIICVDCGVELEVNSRANNRIRCDECKEKADRLKYIKYNKTRK